MLSKQFLLIAAVVATLQIAFIYNSLSKQRGKKTKTLFYSVGFLLPQIIITFIEIPIESGILSSDAPSLKIVLLIGFAVAHYDFLIDSST